VQKIKRVIYPEQCNEKLDALATMEKIEKWVKIKASQNKRFLPKKKTQNESKNDAYLD
jgi:Fe2+ transport system protein B